jgi:hypothetical protein
VQDLRIVSTAAEYFAAIRSLVVQGSDVKIATYNLFTGMLHDGRYMNDWRNPAYHNEVGALFDDLQRAGARVEVKIGKPLFRACPMQDDPRCQMHKQEEKWDGRLVECDKRWPNFTFRILALSHAKLVLIKHPSDLTFSIFGGRNLSDVQLDDLSFISSDARLFARLIAAYDQLK